MSEPYATNLYQIDNLRLSLADMTKKPLVGAAPRLEILKGLSFSIPKGEILGIVGGSGSGKSTLGRALVRLLEPSSGSIQFDGKDITHLPESELRPLRRRFQMIFQDPMSSLNPRHRVGQIIAAPLALHGLSNPHQLALEALDHVGLPRSFANRYPHELSGGQRQRIALARALAVEPKVLLLDEPFGALDAKVRKELRRWLARLHEDINLTSVFVTHDQEEAMEVADRIVVMNKGVIEQIGSPGEVYENPASDFVYHFLGDSNRLHIGEDQHVLFRPHEVSLSRHELEDHHAAQVRDIRPLGATTRVTLKVEGQSELIEVEVVKDHDSLTDLARGETLFFKPKVWQKA